MKYFVSTLVLIYCCSFALAASEDSETGDGQIRLCTCEEMDSCWKQMHEQMKPCTEKCKVSYFFIIT